MTDTFVDIGCWSECQSGTTTPFKSTMTTSETKMKPHKVNYSTSAWSNAHDASRRALFPCENSWDFNPAPPHTMACTSNSSSSSDDTSPYRTIPQYDKIPQYALHSLNANQRALFEDAYGDSVLPFPAQPRRNVFAEVASGMKDVPGWLKSLRLHKYSTLFQQLTYDQMMALNDLVLIQQGVTKGARRKILASVHKLHERVATLTSIQQCHTLNDDTVRSLVYELKTMLYTPIRAYPLPGKPEPIQAKIDGLEIPLGCVDRENLPAHFTRALHHIHHLITQRNIRLDVEHWYALMNMYERCAHHEAFTLAQKRRVQMMKQSGRKQWLSSRSQQYPSLIIPTVNGGYQCINVNQPPPTVLVKSHVYPNRPISTQQPTNQQSELQRMVREVCEAYAQQDPVERPQQQMPTPTTSVNRVQPAEHRMYKQPNFDAAPGHPSTSSPSPLYPLTSPSSSTPYSSSTPLTSSSPLTSCNLPWSDAQWPPHIDNLVSSVAHMAIGYDG